ncbi:MAG: hypothetical protein ACLFNK_01765 [Candidatus Woesearchaeota archaeon]
MSVMIYSPSWFFGLDAALQAISVIVAFVLAFASYRIYLTLKERSFLYFSVSFFLISTSYIVKIFADLFAYNRLSGESYPALDMLLREFTFVEFVNIFGNLAHRFILLLGFLILIVTLLEIIDRRVIFLLSYFIFIVSAFSIWSFLLFQTTLAVFAGTVAVYYIFEYIEKRKKIMLNSLVGFSLLFLAQISFMFTFFFEKKMFVLGHVFQAIAFTMLLITYVMVFRE